VISEAVEAAEITLDYPLRTKAELLARNPSLHKRN
jgi:hypothetical protein